MISLYDQYPPPGNCKRADGSSRFAYLTFVMRNDAYIPGALVFAYAMRFASTQADLVCLVTSTVSPPARRVLEILFDHVLEVDQVFIPHARRQERQDRPYLFTRFHALRAGPSGGLGLDYEKIVLADSDLLPLQCFDHLFTLPAPAGILNEDRSNCMQSDAAGQYILPASLETDGKWNWHEIYEPLCPHGAPIPKEITDRVAHDPANMGINSSLWVLQPSLSEYNAILEDAARPEIQSLVGSAFNWPEMQYATLRWSGQWTNIDLRFSSFNGYPQLAYLCGTHFAGYKPWKFKEPGTFARFSRFPDYALWHRTYLQMLSNYAGLAQLPRLRRLADEITSLPGR